MLLLAALVAFAAIELLAEARSGDRLIERVLSIVVAAGVGQFALVRYRFHLVRAETLAHQAVCPACGVYARWTVVVDATASSAALGVSCKACGEHWTRSSAKSCKPLAASGCARHAPET